LAVFVAISVTAAVGQSDGQRDYPRFNFDVGGGIGIGRGAVGGFVGNSYFGQAGAGLNFNRMFGFNAEYMYYDLPIRPSVSQSQSLNNASGSLNAATLNLIVRPPVHLGKLGFYGIGGFGFYRRSVSARSEILQTGAVCQPAWEQWWGIKCVNGFIQTQQTLGSFSRDAGGYNFGGGLTYRLKTLHDAKVFAEFRYHKAYQRDVKTIVWPFAVGLRW
jgi:hypothetical protein